MSWIITGSQPIPAVIGEPFGGGYFAGYISHTADGNPTHALIVAPAATGATGTGYTLTTTLQQKTSNTTTVGTTSLFDGLSNTNAMVAAGIDDHPAAKFCVDLDIGGYSDWYLPAYDELQIAYFNLKPTNDANSDVYGASIYSVPTRQINYSAGYPAQTFLSLFAGGVESFSAQVHHSSTDGSISTRTRFVSFVNGSTNLLSSKINNYNVRAFRRIAL
jgi:hypothetical protein